MCEYVTTQLLNYVEERREMPPGGEKKTHFLLEVAIGPSVELSKAKAALCPIGKCRNVVVSF